MTYTIAPVAQMAGISVRTLRHYDRIGLLCPSEHTQAGYRLYTGSDLLRLQQILFLRELDFSLERIRALLSAPGFDLTQALSAQIKILQARSARFARLSLLAQDTLENLKGGIPLKNESLFGAFDYEQLSREQKTYEEEVKARWGETDAYKTSQQRTKHYGKDDWARIFDTQQAQTKQLAELYLGGAATDDERVGQLVDQARETISTYFYPCSLEMFCQLGQMYVADARFKAYYDKFAPGLAQFYSDAIRHFCDKNA